MNFKILSSLGTLLILSGCAEYRSTSYPTDSTGQPTFYYTKAELESATTSLQLKEAKLERDVGRKFKMETNFYGGGTYKYITWDYDYLSEYKRRHPTEIWKAYDDFALREYASEVDSYLSRFRECWLKDEFGAYWKNRLDSAAASDLSTKRELALQATKTY